MLPLAAAPTSAEKATGKGRYPASILLGKEALFMYTDQAGLVTLRADIALSLRKVTAHTGNAGPSKVVWLFLRDVSARTRKRVDTRGCKGEAICPQCLTRK